MSHIAASCMHAVVSLARLPGSLLQTIERRNVATVRGPVPGHLRTAVTLFKI